MRCSIFCLTNARELLDSGHCLLIWSLFGFILGLGRHVRDLAQAEFILTQSDAARSLLGSFVTQLFLFSCWLFRMDSSLIFLCGCVVLMPLLGWKRFPKCAATNFLARETAILAVVAVLWSWDLETATATATATATGLVDTFSSHKWMWWAQVFMSFLIVHELTEYKFWAKRFALTGTPALSFRRMFCIRREDHDDLDDRDDDHDNEDHDNEDEAGFRWAGEPLENEVAHDSASDSATDDDGDNSDVEEENAELHAFANAHAHAHALQAQRQVQFQAALQVEHPAAAARAQRELQAVVELQVERELQLQAVLELQVDRELQLQVQDADAAAVSISIILVEAMLAFTLLCIILFPIL
jgi:hypothetical protein